MNIALWVVAILLALMFGFSGVNKVLATDKYREGAAWAQSVAPRTVQSIGALEILGAVGIILPEWTGVLPWLTIEAASCLVLLQLVAMGLHIRRKEYSIVPINPGAACVAAVRRIWSPMVDLAMVRTMVGSNGPGRLYRGGNASLASVESVIHRAPAVVKLPTENFNDRSSVEWLRALFMPRRVT